MRFLPQARRALAALSFTFIAGAALAQVPIDTASGVLQVVGERFEKRLFVGAEGIPVEDGLMSIEVAERLGDTFLMQTFTGGNACPSFFFWLETAPGDLRRSADFGSCADEYELDVGHDTLTVTMSAFDNSGGRIAMIMTDASLSNERLARRRPACRRRRAATFGKGVILSNFCRRQNGVPASSR